MKNKRLLLLMLAIVLVFGMAVLGWCDDDTTKDGLDPALFGKWINAEYGEEWTFNSNGTFRWEWGGETENGNWSVSDDILTITYRGESEFCVYNFNGGSLYFDGDGPYVKK
jgi:hypothetical protein